MENETKEIPSEDERPLKIAVERGKRFEAELRTADGATRGQILSAWKELIMEEMVELLRATSDVLTLQCLDNQIAVGKEIAFGAPRDEPNS